MPRTMTPSMVELPKYDGSWGSVDSGESKGSAEEKMDEKERPTGEERGNVWAGKELPALPEEEEEDLEREKDEKVRLGSYYDDASDEEEARVDRGKEANGRLGGRRSEYSRRMS